MAQYVPSSHPRARAVRCTQKEIIVTLTDRRVLHVPIDWFDLLKAARPEALQRCEIGFGGLFLHWPDVGEDISVERLLSPPCDLERAQYDGLIA